MVQFITGESPAFLYKLNALHSIKPAKCQVLYNNVESSSLSQQSGGLFDDVFLKTLMAATTTTEEEKTKESLRDPITAALAGTGVTLLTLAFTQSHQNKLPDENLAIS